MVKHLEAATNGLKSERLIKIGPNHLPRIKKNKMETSLKPPAAGWLKYINAICPLAL